MTVDYIRIPIELLKLRLGQTEMMILSLTISFGKRGLLLSNNQLSKILGISRRNVIYAINRLRNRGYLVDVGESKQIRKLIVGERIRELLIVLPAAPGSDATSTINGIGNDEGVVLPAAPGSDATSTKVVPPASLHITKETKDQLKKRRNSEEFRLATFLFQEIRKRKPDFREPNLQSWAKHIDRMIRIDHRKPESIEKVIRWAQNDSGNNDGQWRGWRNNILSTSKLREKFDRLELAMKESSGSGTVQLVRDAEGFTPRERELERIRVEGNREKLLAEIEEATAHG